MKNKYIKFIGLLTLLLAVTANVYSGPRTRLGTSAAPELLIPIGSIGTSLGGTNLSSTTGVDAMYWNPAGISKFDSKNGEAIFSHMSMFGDMSMQYFSVVSNVGSLGVVGGSIRSLNIGEIIETNEFQPEGTGSVITPTYLVANVSFARQMTDRIRFGTNVKYINEQIGTVSAGGFALDFGLQYVTPVGISFGIALKNLGPSMTFDGIGLNRSISVGGGQSETRRITLQEFDLPTTLELGVGYSTAFNKQNNVTISTAFRNSGYSSDEYKVGLEYNYNKIFYLRGGVAILSDVDKDLDEEMVRPSFGAGLKYNFGSLILGFDYAYRMKEDSAFDDVNQHFSLNVGF